MGYIGLALCKHDNDQRLWLFQMPKLNSLEEGERVIVETAKGEAMATVVASADYLDVNSDEFRLILRSAGVKDVSDLKRVLKKVRYYDLKYPEADA